MPELAGVVAAWGKPAADTLNADPRTMKRTASYLIVITRNGDGYTATCPAFPEIAANAKGSRQAYARIKLQVKTRLLRLFAAGETPPPDPVIQTRTLRLDLWYLKEQEELR